MNSDNKLPLRLEETITVGKKVAFCRCWQSKNFPYCDGSHRAYNEAKGDNIGPVVVTCIPEPSGEQSNL